MNREGGEGLDDLFKKGLENSEGNITYQEQDWDNLANLLDQHKRRKFIYLMPLLAGVAAILLLVLGWWFFKPDGQSTKPPVAIARLRNKPQTIVKDSAINSHSQTEHITTAANNHQLNSGNVKQHFTATTGHQPATTLAEAARLTHHGADAQSDNVLVSTQPSKSESKPVVGGADPLAGDVTDTKTTAEMLSALSSTGGNGNINLGNTDSSITASHAAPLKGKDVLAAKGTIKIKPKSNRGFPQLAVTVLASPDVNGVGSFANSKLGTNAGLIFSVSVFKKLTISTGAVYSKKPYNTDFDNYHTNYKFKTNPEYVSADCRVLDIPINIDYQVYNKNKNKITVGSGLSSYLMLRENYHYNYTTPNTTGPTDYDISNKNKHILGVLNLNAAYQRRLNSKLSLDFEPYLKIPLTKIGYSQVKLQSAGMAVGVSWNINTKH